MADPNDREFLAHVDIIDRVHANPVLYSIFKMPYLAMLLGRPGTRKLERFLEAMKEKNVECTVMDGKNPHSDVITTRATGKPADTDVLIIDHADGLIRPPIATQESREFAFALKEMAETQRRFIVCLFDVVPRELDPRDERAQQFIKDFDRIIYCSTPNLKERAASFEAELILLRDHAKANGGRAIEVSLTADDYEYLAEISADATRAEIRTFCEETILTALHAPNTIVSRDFIETMLHPLNETTRSIVPYECRSREDVFRQACGFVKPSGRAMRAYRQAAAASTTNEEEEDSCEIITGAPPQKKARTESVSESALESGPTGELTI